MSTQLAGKAPASYDVPHAVTVISVVPRCFAPYGARSAPTGTEAGRYEEAT